MIPQVALVILLDHKLNIAAFNQHNFKTKNGNIYDGVHFKEHLKTLQHILHEVIQRNYRVYLAYLCSMNSSQTTSTSKHLNGPYPNFSNTQNPRN